MITAWSVASGVWHLLGYGLDTLLLLAGAALFVAGAVGRLIPALAVVPGVAFPPMRYAGLALMLYGGGALWLRQHDDALKVAWAADQKAAAAKELSDAYLAGQNAVAATHAAEIAAMERSRPIKQEITRRAETAPMAVSAADTAALDELRRRASGRP